MTRARVLDQVAAEVLHARADGITRVAVDGVDGAGKTTFADALAALLVPAGRQVIRASVDDFHRPERLRYARGRDSPEGFYLDSYDHEALRERLLDPLSPGGSRRFRRRAFDHREDRPVEAPLEAADADAILLLDGIFLHRDELRGYWDYSVFRDVPVDVAVPRGAARGEGFGAPDPSAPSNRRYVLGQQRYLAECDPARRATRVIDNR